MQYCSLQHTISNIHNDYFFWIMPGKQESVFLVIYVFNFASRRLWIIPNHSKDNAYVLRYIWHKTYYVYVSIVTSLHQCNYYGMSLRRDAIPSNNRSLIVQWIQARARESWQSYELRMWVHKIPVNLYPGKKSWGEFQISINVSNIHLTVNEPIISRALSAKLQ